MKSLWWKLSIIFLGLWVSACAQTQISAPPEPQNITSICDADDKVCIIANEMYEATRGKPLSDEDLSRYFSMNISCPESVDTKLAPVQAELPSFIRRSGEPGERMHWPLNAKCMLVAYGEEALTRWADQGDPVAKYSLAYALVYKDRCEAFGKVTQLLSEALKVKRPGPESSSLRVPEAGLALSGIAFHCGTRDVAIYYYREYYITARFGGLAKNVSVD